MIPLLELGDGVDDVSGAHLDRALTHLGECSGFFKQQVLFGMGQQGGVAGWMDSIPPPHTAASRFQNITRTLNTEGAGRLGAFP